MCCLRSGRGASLFARVLDGRRAVPYLYEGALAGAHTGCPAGRAVAAAPGWPGRAPDVRRPNGARCRRRSTCAGVGWRLSAWEYKGTLDAPASEIRIVETRKRTTRVVDRVRGGGLTNIERVVAELRRGEPLFTLASASATRAGALTGPALGEGYRVTTRKLAFAPISRGDMWQARTGGFTYLLRDASFDHLCHPFEGSAGAYLPNPRHAAGAYGSSI